MLAAATTLLAAVAVAVAVWKLAARFELSRARTAVGSAVGAIVAALAVSEAMSGAVGAFWEEHPINASLLTGLLLLALTVLVVEALIERHIAAAEDRRWQSTAETAAQALLSDLGRTYASYRSLMLGLTEGVERGATPKPGDLDHLAKRLREQVLAAHEILTRTPRLHRTYEHALFIVRTADQLTQRHESWYAFASRSAEDRPPEWISDHYQWWAQVIWAWDMLTKAVVGFSEEAQENLHAYGRYLEPVPPWHQPEPQWILQARDRHQQRAAEVYEAQQSDDERLPGERVAEG